MICAGCCGREPEPTAAILDSRTLRSTPESAARGEALAGLSWRLHTSGQGGCYPNTLSRQSQR
jgi:hypothetical protein